ncbi:MAG: hypothetical protein L6R41_001971 [Letrouitia leprolyta]|nr:MAG: hypothetical protein L6R41_001971 [Letrouitia leprolyta]
MLTDGPSFCRKTTLTKHFKRYHPIKAEDSGISLMDEEDEDGCGESDEEESGSESEVTPPETQMNRQSSYYGDHWPLPCETVQRPNPSSLPGPLTLRPKSNLDRVKLERPRSMPLPTLFHSEQNAKTSNSPCQFPPENTMDPLASPTAMQSSPTSYSDMSSIPDSAHTTLFFAGPTSQPYSSQDEPPSVDYQPVVSLEEPIQDAGQQQYDMEPKPMIQAQLLYEGNPMGLQPQVIQDLTYYAGVPYPTPIEQYYSTPQWLENFKPADAWPVLPSERVQTYAGWNQ